MKLLILLTFLFPLAQAHVVETPLERSVSQQLNMLFSDTVNEGDLRATAVESKCVLRPTRTPKLEIADCMVSVDLELIYADPIESCQHQCEVEFKIKGKDLNSLDVVDSTAVACFELLSSGC